MAGWERNEWNTPAAPGTIWVCSACGRHGPVKGRLGDTSCVMHAVLCDTDSLRFDAEGRLTAARAHVAEE